MSRLAGPNGPKVLVSAQVNKTVAASVKSYAATFGITRSQAINKLLADALKIKTK